MINCEMGIANCELSIAFASCPLPKLYRGREASTTSNAYSDIRKTQVRVPLSELPQGPLDVSPFIRARSPIRLLNIPLLTTIWVADHNYKSHLEPLWQQAHMRSPHIEAKNAPSEDKNRELRRRIRHYITHRSKECTKRT